MRKAVAVLIIILFCSWANSAYAQDLRLGSINLKEVLDNYKKVQDVEEALLKEAEKKNDQRDKLVKEIRNLRERIDLLKDKQKKKKQQELDEKIQELQDFTHQTRTSLGQDRDEKLREIMKEVKDVIEEYGQSRNYNIIIDDAFLFYRDKDLTVTDDVVKTLNQRYKK